MHTNTHEADGLYYLDLNLLNSRAACYAQMARWQNFFGHEQTPITLKVLRKMHVPGNRCVNWAVCVMHRRGLITVGEFNRFCNAYDSAGSDWHSPARLKAERIAFMNLLAARARREGRLP